MTHLLEGSVRRSGSKLRISAEVVKASNGERVWSETYERELTDVFAIQDEIARSVVRELAPMLLARTPPPPPATTTDPEAYRLFLLGRAVNAQGTRESYRRAKEALERSVAIDPRFAPAQAYLAVVLGNCSLTERGGERQRLRSAGKAAAERAIALDSVLSVGIHRPRVVPDATGPRLGGSVGGHRPGSRARPEQRVRPERPGSPAHHVWAGRRRRWIWSGAPWT